MGDQQPEQEPVEEFVEFPKDDWYVLHGNYDGYIGHLPCKYRDIATQYYHNRFWFTINERYPVKCPHCEEVLPKEVERYFKQLHILMKPDERGPAPVGG